MLAACRNTWDLVMLALRAGGNPQALITTTPRRVAVLKRILAEATTVQTTDTTYANQAHLPPEFIAQIVSLYENTRLGRQEIYAEFLDTTEGVWFGNFDPARHVSLEAEYHPGYSGPVCDRCWDFAAYGGGVLSGSAESGSGRPLVTVLASTTRLTWSARRMPWPSRHWPMNCRAAAGSNWCGWTRRRRRGRRWDRRPTVNTSVCSDREIVARWPQHLVLDGLDTIELLLDSGNLVIHPRCIRLKEAFGNYRRERRGGELIDFPADGHPEEDMMDALRGGIRDALPDGGVTMPALPRIHASRIF